MNVLAQIVVAAAHGRAALEADGIHVDRDEFDRALKSIADLARMVTPPAPPRNSSENGVMNAQDVAQITGLGQHAVRKAARSGHLAGTLAEGRWTFTTEAVESWNRQRGQADG